MKKITSAFFTAFTTLSRIPVSRRFEVDYSWFGFFLPVIGVFAAIPLWLASFIVRVIPSTPVVAIAGLVVQYWVFNLFHFDGLLDSADGLLFQGSRERRLEILKDSAVGSYALFTGVLYLVAKVVLVAGSLEKATAIPPAERFALLAMVPVAARIGCAYIPLLLRNVRSGGFGAVLTTQTPLPALAGTVLFTGAWALLIIFAPVPSISPLLGLTVFFSVPVTVAFAVVVFRTRIGGYTGDTLGATIEIGEIAALLALYSVLS